MSVHYTQIGPFSDVRRVGVIGYRSWIAHHLITEIEFRGHHRVVLHEKEDPAESQSAARPNQPGYVDFAELDCLYVFPGRSNPTEVEMENERILVSQILSIPSHKLPRRIFMIGSQASWITPYGQHKQWIEEEVRAAQHRVPLVLLRSPAVFGPGQPIESPMLVPSLARERGELEIRTPDLLTKFISVHDLVAHMARFADPKYWNSNGEGEPGSCFEIPGTFTLTPSQMRDLFRTWESYR